MKNLLMITSGVILISFSYTLGQSKKVPVKNDSMQGKYQAISLKGRKVLFPKEGLRNGLYWLKLDKTGKESTIEGIKYGVKLFWKDAAAFATKDSGTSRSIKIASREDTTTFSTQELIQQINIVYSDSTNIHIPIGFVYSYVVEKLSGVPKKKLRHILSVWKKDWN